MKRTEFVEKVAERLGQSKKDAVEFVTWLEDTIVATVKSGDELVLQIGKFILVKREAREGKNPLTGEKIKIPAKIVPKFRPNKKFKEEVLGGKKPAPKK